eukprot:gene16941-biopygen6766
MITMDHGLETQRPQFKSRARSGVFHWDSGNADMQGPGPSAVSMNLTRHTGTRQQMPLSIKIPFACSGPKRLADRLFTAWGVPTRMSWGPEVPHSERGKGQGRSGRGVQAVH